MSLRPAPALCYDFLRLFLGAWDRTPRGVDRVDLAYARHLFTHWPGDCFGLLPTPWGLRLFGRARVLRGLDRLEALWREGGESGADHVFVALRERLAGGAVGAPAPRPRAAVALLGSAGRQMRLLAATGLVPGAAVVRAAPAGALYLNVGQLGWAAPWTARWLHARADIRPVYMLHDVIPLEYPDLVSRIGHVTHRRMVDVAARHAAGLIFTTAAAAASVCRALQARGHTPGAALAMPLPLPPVFWHREEDDAVLREKVYFVIHGAIEPRKNHLLLLAVWRRLVGLRGAGAPRLVVIGAPARGGPPIVQALTREAALRDHIILASGLSSPALRRLIAHARAVLMPSRAEGFGLPIIEALALGTPVLASDLPAHREVGEALAIYLDPDDAEGWLAAIGQLLDAPGPLAALRARIAVYRPLSEAAYFVAVTAFLHRVGNAPAGDDTALTLAARTVSKP